MSKRKLNIAKITLVMLMTSFFFAAYVFFQTSWFDQMRVSLFEKSVPSVASAGNPEDGAPCDAPRVEGDFLQGVRMHFTLDDLPPRGGHRVDVPELFNEKCLRHGVGEGDKADVPKGGFSDATVEFDIEEVINSFAAGERAAADAPTFAGWEYSMVSVYDNDITGDDTTPHAVQDFPFSCNTIFTRKREGLFPGGHKPRVQNRANVGSFCCSNGWGQQEFVEDNAPDSRDTAEDPGGQDETQPEPDADGYGANGYQGSMTIHTVVRWFRTTEPIDVTLEQVPSTDLDVTFTSIIPWPGLLHTHLTPIGGANSGTVIGSFTDAEAGNGVRDEAISAAGCDPGADDHVVPFDPPEGEDDWVVPNAFICPPDTPEYDDEGNYAWSHGEPFRDSNHNGVYDAGSEDFADIGNGYNGTGDTWTFISPTIGSEVEPELTFNRQFIDIGMSYRADAAIGDRNDRFVYNPITNISVRGIFREYTATACTCRPVDNIDPAKTEENPLGDPNFIPCQAVFADYFNPELCGYCGSNQPIVNVGRTEYPDDMYCEDTLPRSNNFRWPPFNLSVLGLDWEVSSGTISEMFDTVLKDANPTPKVSIINSPVSPRKGEKVRVSAIPTNFFTPPDEDYFGWLINNNSQQGLVAGATERVPEHRFPPDFVERFDDGTVVRHPETREFYKAPVRAPKYDDDKDGMDDAWERHYFGNIDAVGPLDDPDNDGHVADDFARSVTDVIDKEKNDDGTQATYLDHGRFIYVTPGVWWVRKGQEDTFIAPANFNPEWFGIEDKAPGLTNVEEYVWGTDPTDPDTDDDGYADGVDLLGIAQSQWSYVNPWSKKDYDSRDEIGAVVMGFGNLTSEQAQEPFVQIVCNSRVIFPGSSSELSATLSFEPKVPIPGEPLKITAGVSGENVREGFLSYDWYIDGKPLETGVQGKNVIELDGNTTSAYTSGTVKNIRVVAYNPNESQESFGSRADVSENILVGVRLDAIEVYQGGKLIFPFPSDELNEETRYKAYLSTIQNGISINRFDNIQIVLSNIWENDVANNLYFEWIADGERQQDDSGRGADRATFSFIPKDFLPDGVPDDQPIGKSLNLVARGIDIASQKEVLRLGLTFIYETPDAFIEKVDSTGDAITLLATPNYFASSDKLHYTWSIDGDTLYEGDGLSQVRLSYLQASAARLVTLKVTPIGKTTPVISRDYTVPIGELRVPWYQKIAFEAWRIIVNFPYYVSVALRLATFMNLGVIVFFMIYFFIERSKIFRRYAS